MRKNGLENLILTERTKGRRSEEGITNNLHNTRVNGWLAKNKRGMVKGQK